MRVVDKLLNARFIAILSVPACSAHLIYSTVYRLSCFIHYNAGKLRQNLRINLSECDGAAKRKKNSLDVQKWCYTKTRLILIKHDIIGRKNLTLKNLADGQVAVGSTSHLAAYTPTCCRVVLKKYSFCL